MSGISMGTQLVAPEGFRNLEKGVTYFFLRSSSTRQRVLLIEFRERGPRQVTHKSQKRPTKSVTPEPFPKFVFVDRDSFEHGVDPDNRRIIKAERQRTLPPWLEELEGMNLALVDSYRKEPVLKHSDRIDEKLAVILPLVSNLNDILDHDDPERLINEHARGFKKNETRVRLWFLCYILFGRNRFALHYPIHKIGRWDRMSNPGSAKRGHPSKKGKEYGYNTDAEMKELILAGYRRECGLGVTMDQIYVRSMLRDFGCKARDVNNGHRKFTEIWHPDGKPFPQRGTFEYYVDKEYGQKTVSTILIGKVQARSEILPEKGAFTEHTMNLMQRVDADAYAVEELARGLVEGHPLPPLYVVTRRDYRSGIKSGIGFSQGSETSSAYRTAKFCEAIPKVRFCKLFGIAITPDQWPSQGLCPNEAVDRGAGATPGAQGRYFELDPVIDGMAPSHSGQSKAVVESSHPKNRHDKEAPSFFQSELSTVELIRREIFALLKFNASSSVRSRIPPDLAAKITGNNPNALYVLLDERGRNDAEQITFEQAVRNFLDLRPAKLTDAGVLLHGQVYKSAALTQSGACEAVAGRKDMPIQVYVFEGCTRHIWFDWHGQLVEVDLTFSVPVPNGVLHMSLAALEEFEAYLNELGYEHRENRLAVALATYEAFRTNTGKDWDAGSRKAGRAKRGSRAAKQEAAEAKNATRGQEAA
ncbi:hypothetical protein [Thiobacillus sedimenti]|uniref:Transposase n=1 Tax=Thiobacillus sedimenti TaxID=3110231 RepID=A0ABZ1CJ27_9PROT|nr:hypothetical protein [Thiobacillus sp. SCUT-2]WRS39246.1 hypothetical protein VA613_14760 [Thiobacillus sp. SCUT-2]